MRSALKRVTATILAVTLMATGARAVDLYPVLDGPVPTNWTGFVVAPYFGYETMKLKGAGAGAIDDPKGWRIGAEIDYDYQIGRFVVGVAGDAFYTWYDGSGGAQGELDARMHDYETVRGRLGYTFGRWMVFGTGGVAFGDLEVTNALSGVSKRQMLTGWTAGGGVEWVWNNDLTLRGEVAHMDFGQANFSSLSGPSQELGANLDIFKIDFISRF